MLNKIINTRNVPKFRVCGLTDDHICRWIMCGNILGIYLGQNRMIPINPPGLPLLLNEDSLVSFIDVIIEDCLSAGKKDIEYKDMAIGDCVGVFDSCYKWNYFSIRISENEWLTIDNTIENSAILSDIGYYTGKILTGLKLSY